MKSTIGLVLTALLLSGSIEARVNVRGYFTYDGVEYLVTKHNPFEVSIGTGSRPAIDKGATGSITIPNTVTDEDGDSYAVTSMAYAPFAGCEGITSVTLPNSISTISDLAFDGCTKLSSITIPNSIKEIGAQAFSDCSGLKSVNIGSGVEKIGWGAFLGCKSLKSVHIPGNVKTLDGAVFRSCKNLESVTIGNGVESMGSEIFKGCSALTAVTIPNSVKKLGDMAFYECSSLQSVTIGSGLKEIDRETFKLCTALKTVKIASSVTIIGYGAFYECTALKKVTIPGSVEEIGRSAFSGCTSLVSVIIPNGVKKIAQDAYRGADKVATLIIGSEVTTIEMNGLEFLKDGCALTDVYCKAKQVPQTNAMAFAWSGNMNGITLHVPRVSRNDYKAVTPWDKFANIEGMTTAAFQEIDDKTTLVDGGEEGGDVTVPSSVDLNGKSSKVMAIGATAYMDNTSLTSITIPNGVTDIGADAFNGCSNMTAVTIGSDIAVIESRAFANLTPSASVRTRATESGLKIKCLAAEVPATDEDVFENTDIASATLIVPDGSIDAYKAAAPWSGFGQILGVSDPAGITIVKTQPVSPSIYSLSGQRLTAPRKGLNIIEGKKVVMK